MSIPAYATREVVKAALDDKGGNLAYAQLDRLIKTHARLIDKRMHRTFYPWHGTRSFNWPASSGGNVRSPSWVLELGNHELAELTGLSTAGETIDLGQVLLEPVNDGPPYTRIELDRGTSAAFRSGSTPQRSVLVTGVFAGCPLDETLAPGTAGAIDDSTTQLTLTAASGIGTGSLLRLDNERLIVTRMDWADSGLTITEPMSDRASDAVVYLSSSVLAPEPGEVIAVDVERMLVTDRVGTACAVRRAVDGSQLASHADNTAVYARRALTVERGVVGTTAAAHGSGADIYRFDYPAPITTLNVQEVVAAVMAELSGMARTVGTAEAERESSNRALADARREARAYQRRNRNRAV